MKFACPIIRVYICVCVLCVCVCVLAVCVRTCNCVCWLLQTSSAAKLRVRTTRCRWSAILTPALLFTLPATDGQNTRASSVRSPRECLRKVSTSSRSDTVARCSDRRSEICSVSFSSSFQRTLMFDMHYLGSSVGIVTRLRARWSGVWIPAGAGDIAFLQNFTPGCRTQHPILWVPWGAFPCE